MTTAALIADDPPDEGVRPVDRADAVAPPSWLTPRRSRLVAALLVMIAVSPMFAAFAEDLGQHWYPGGDWAIIGFDTMDVGTAHTPLVGVYSRDGWNHPGPMLFWLYAVPYRLTGGRFSSMLLCAALVNAIAVAGMVFFAWRRGGLALAAFTTLAAASVVNTLGLAFLRDPWNPWVTVLPFGLVVMAAWAAGEGDTIALMATAVVGAFLIQTHVGFVPLVGLLLVIAGVGFWRRRRVRRPLVIAGSVFALCWLPVVVDLLRGGDNVERLASFFVTSKEATAGLSYAIGVTAVELGIRPAWLGGPEPANPVGGGLLPAALSGLALAVIPFLVVAVFAWRSRHRAPQSWRFLLTVGATAAVGVFAVSRVSGPVFSYLIRWWWPVAALWWVAMAWALWNLLGTRFRAGARTTLLVVGCVLLSAVLATRTATADAGQSSTDDLNLAQAPIALLRSEATPLIPVDRPVIVRWIGPKVGWVSNGFALQLAHDGRDVRVEDAGTNREMFGAQRLATPDGSQRVLWVATGSWIDDLERTMPTSGSVELAKWDPLPPDQRQAANALMADLRARFRSGHRDDLEADLDSGNSIYHAKDFPGVTDDMIRTWDHYQTGGQPTAVFLYDRSDRADLPPHQQTSA